MTHDTQNNMILIYSSMILIFFKEALFFLNSNWRNFSYLRKNSRVENCFCSLDTCSNWQETQNLKTLVNHMEDQLQLVAISWEPGSYALELRQALMLFCCAWNSASALKSPVERKSFWKQRGNLKFRACDALKGLDDLGWPMDFYLPF